MQEKMPRKIKPEECLELKAMTRRALEMARPTKLALVTRVDAPTLVNYGAVSQHNCLMPIDIAIDVCRDLGAPLIVEEMARLLGFRLVPLDQAEGDGGEVGYADLAAVSKESNDVVSKLADALADGPLDGAERREVRKEIAEDIATLYRLDRKIAGGGH